MKKLQLTKEQWNYLNTKKNKKTILATFYKIEFLQQAQGYCDYTYPELAKMLKIGVSTLKRCITELQNLGLLIKTKAHFWDKKLVAVRPKIEEKLNVENIEKSTSEPLSGPTSGLIYINSNKILKYKKISNIVSNESLTSDEEKLNKITEELKEKYPVEIVAEALRIYLFKKLEQKIYSVSKYIEGTCKNLIRNKKSRIRKIHKRRKKEELAELQEQKFEQMAQDKAQREANEDSLIKMFKEMAEDRAKRVTEIINLIGDYDWMNDDNLQFDLYANT